MAPLVPPTLLLRTSIAVALIEQAMIHGPSSGQTAPKSPVQQLVLLDGSAVSFQSLEIKDGKLSGGGVPADLALDDLRRIELSAAAAAPAKPSAVVELRGSGRVFST